MSDKTFTITVRDEEFSPIIKRELEWMRDHIIASGPDYCRSKRARDTAIKALSVVIEIYTPR